jgi:hypothetical protein
MNWEKINSTVRELIRRNGREVSIHRLSLSEVLQREPMPDVDAMTDEQLREYADTDCIAIPKGACRDEVVELIREHKDKLWHARVRGFVDALDLIARDGPHPIAVARNFYAFAKAVRPQCVLDASLAELATLGGDGNGMRGGNGRATVSARIKRKVEKPMKDAGMRGYKLPFQKTETACESYRDSAMGNQNRHGKAFLEVQGQQQKRKAAA